MSDQTIDTLLVHYMGQAVFVRTVTMHFVGQVVAITPQFVKLKEASWVADSGRWSAALKTGRLLEVEPYPDGVLVAVAAIIDVTRWNHPLPR